MCCCHVACADWWVFLHNPWVSRCFSVVCALVFLNFLPLSFSQFLNLLLYTSSSPSTLATTLILLRRFSASNLCCIFFRYVSPFLSFFLFFVICCEFLISPFFLSLFFCDCCCSSVCFWVCSVYFILFALFLGVHGR